jgi:hypothetical protein
MVQTTSHLPPNRHVPAHTNQGWPIAIAIVVLAIVVNAAVYTLHERTSSRHPRDPMFRAAGSAPETPLGAAEGNHGDNRPTGQGGHGTGGEQH